MTAPGPDLLDAIVARYPGMVTCWQTPAGNWALAITDTDLDVTWHVGAQGRMGITGAAQAWERYRDSYLHGPQRCTCGALYGQHAWDAAGKRRGACPPPDEHHRYEPEDLAVLAGQETHSA